MPDKLTIFDPGLPNTPGWVKLSEAKREWLQQKTSNIKKYGAMEGLAAASGAVELYEIREGLKDETMTITNYIDTVFSSSPITGWRRLKEIDRLVEQGWSIPIIKAVAERGALLLKGSVGIGLRELANVAKDLPAPKGTDEKTIDGFISTKVRETLREQRSARAKASRTPIRLSDDLAAKLAFNKILSVMKKNKSLKSTADDRHFLRAVIGWVMEARAIPGELSCKRISIPDGTIAKVGRPRLLKGKVA